MKNSYTSPNIKSTLRHPFFVLPTLIGCIVLSVTSCEETPAPIESSTEKTAGYYAFRNSVDEVPKGWDGPVFQLSHDYPKTLPAGGSEMPWLKIEVDFTDKNPDWTKGKWKEYMDAIIDYAFEQQDPNLTNNSGWKVDVDGETRWFHVPWMAYNPSVGREFIHGCTSERIASVSDFDGPSKGSGLGILQHANAANSATHFETWAVGMYNEYAGYAFGQLFPESGEPKLVTKNGKQLPAGLPFPVGTCVVKTLFTTATSKEVPFLKNSPKWIVNRHVLVGDTTYTCERKPQAVYLVQVDVAVVDPRSPTNWVYGTFAYNGTLSGKTAKERLDPVGIQYAMDPETFPAVNSPESIPAYQSVLNNRIDIYEHFGCNGRLCGPVDNPAASCMSCHGGSYTAPMNQLDKMGTNIPAIFGFTNMCDSFSTENVAFFSNRKFPDPYYPGMFTNAIPLDFSLQVQVAFSQYKIFKLKGKPSPCKPTTP